MADLHFPNANTRATALLDVGLALGCRPIGKRSEGWTWRLLGL